MKKILLISAVLAALATGVQAQDGSFDKLYKGLPVPAAVPAAPAPAPAAPGPSRPAAPGAAPERPKLGTRAETVAPGAPPPGALPERPRVVARPPEEERTRG